MKNLFPIILIILDLCASVTYLCYGDYRRMVYWLAASILTLTVTI
jgi:hypothetical protein